MERKMVVTLFQTLSTFSVFDPQKIRVAVTLESLFHKAKSCNMKQYIPLFSFEDENFLCYFQMHLITSMYLISSMILQIIRSIQNPRNGLLELLLKNQQKQQMEMYRPYHNKANSNASPNKANLEQKNNYNNKKSSQTGSKDQLSSLQQKLFIIQKKFSKNQDVNIQSGTASLNDYYGEKIINESYQTNGKKVILTEIQYLRSKVQTLQSKSTQLKQQIQYQKNIFKTNSHKKESLNINQSKQVYQHYQRAVEALEKKLQVMVKQIAMTIKNLSNNLQDKFNSRQNQNKQIYEQCSKIRNAYLKNIQKQQSIYKQQLQSIVDQIKKRETQYVNRIEAFQMKKNQMMQQYGKRETEYLNQIFLLQEKIRRITDINKGTPFQDKDKRKPVLKLKSGNIEYAFIGALQNRIQITKLPIKFSPTKNIQQVKQGEANRKKQIFRQNTQVLTKQPEMIYLKQRVSELPIFKNNSAKNIQQIPISKKKSSQSNESIDSLMEYSQSLIKRQSQILRNQEDDSKKHKYSSLQRQSEKQDIAYFNDYKLQNNLQESITLMPFSYDSKIKLSGDSNQNILQSHYQANKEGKQATIPLEKTRQNTFSNIYKGTGTRDWQTFSEGQGSQQDSKDQFY